MLTEPKLKLIFTYREPLGAFFSYFHQYHVEQEWTIPIFTAWTSNALKLYNQYTTCVSNLAADAGFSDGFPLSTPPTWVGVQDFDELAYVKCQMPIHEKSEQDLINFLSIPMYIYSHSITRWMRVLPNAEMVCVEHEALLARPAEHVESMLVWLGLAEKHGNQSVSYFGDSNSNTFEKFLMTATPEQASVVQDLYGQLKAIFADQLEFARTICSFLA